MEDKPAQNVDLNNAKEVDIKDSNVKINISTGESKTANAQVKQTDYMSLGVIVAIILALAAYFLLTGDGSPTTSNP